MQVRIYSFLIDHSYVNLQDIPVMCVKPGVKGAGPAKAFDFLESKLPTLRGRKFCGIYRVNSDGTEDCYACVAKIDTDDPLKMELETGVIF